MTQRRGENTRVHFWTQFSPVSVNRLVTLTLFHNFHLFIFLGKFYKYIKTFFGES